MGLTLDFRKEHHGFRRWHVRKQSDRCKTDMVKHASSGSRTFLSIVLVAFLAQSALAASSLDERLFRDANRGDLPAVEWDIAKGADVNAHVVLGQTALYVASMHGHLSTVRCLLEHGAKVNVKDDDGETPLEMTAAFGQPDVVQLLISHGADINARDEWGHTPLYLAAKYNSMHVAQILLEHGAVLDHETLLASKDQAMVDFLRFYDPRVADELKTANALEKQTAQREAADLVFNAEVSAGDAAVRSGDVADALPHYLAALQRLTEQGILTKTEQSLLEKIIGNVRQMHVPPAIPQKAIDHAEVALVATEAAQPNAGPSLDGVVREWEKVVEIAPWWSQAYLNLGTALQKADRPIEAAQALNLYLIANPHSANDQNVRMEIYKLEYQANRVQGSLLNSGPELKTETN